jgi:hypothetical protein
MKPEPKAAHPDSVNARLASYLCEHREPIMLEWLDRVRADREIPTGGLTTAQLKDHVPHLFNDLADTLRLYGSEAVAARSEEDAETHGDTRWEQGYELPDLLREIKHLRTILIYHLLAFEELNPDFGMVPRLFALSTLHRFLDNMAIDATVEFVKARETEQITMGAEGPY